MKETLTEILSYALKKSKENGELELKEDIPVILEVPSDEKYGDLATNLAMILASKEKKKPREVAQTILKNMEDGNTIIKKTEIAGPGFINFYFKKSHWYDILKEGVSQDERYGCSDIGKAKKIQVEFVSANPTGPLHVGHGRGAAVGDALANILKAVGYDVQKEYYINDAGSQMETLGRSVMVRYKQLLGKDIPFIANGYQGEYIFDIAKDVIAKKGNCFLEKMEEESLSFFTEFAVEIILKGIRKDLQDFGVEFDNWFSEKSLYTSEDVQGVINSLKKKDFIYEKDGAWWLKSTGLEDDKDRVVIRANGEPTYFASDMAYHRNKFERGFKKVIDIWGADHHGYIPRIKAMIKALDYPQDSLKILLVQLVSLLRGGKLVAMSTRAGEFDTLAQVVREVGKDAARYFFLMRRSDSHLDFDLELAKTQSNENPVYYVQYAHARICSIFQQARERGVDLINLTKVDLALLDLPEELTIIKRIAIYPEIVEGSALSFEPHRITFYLQELAGCLHSYYFKHRVVSDNKGLTNARLFLMNAVRIVLRNALGLLGVAAPEKM